MTRSSGARSARRWPAGRGVSRATEEVTLGGGTKAEGAHVEQAADLADMLGQHRQAAVVLGARHGGQAVGHLLLEHQHHVGDVVGLRAASAPAARVEML